MVNFWKEGDDSVGGDEDMVSGGWGVKENHGEWKNGEGCDQNW